MWTNYEIQCVGDMYAKLKEEKIEDFLPSDLVNLIKAEGGLTYENLR